MSTNRRIGVLVAVVLTCLATGTVFAQSRSESGDSQQQSTLPEGWQGPRPVPQQRLPVPAPQKSIPSGKQVLEIPSQPQQQPARAPLQQQLEITPRPQPDFALRRQHEMRRAPQAVTVTVTDLQGGYIPGLTREDFALYEDGVRKEITYFNTGDSEPVSLGLIVDTSGSMRNKIDRAQQALHRFISSIRRQDEVFLEEFNGQPSLLQDFTDSRMLLGQAVSLLRPIGGTALYDAVLDGLRRVKRGRNQKKALVIITDGLDTASLSSLNQTTYIAKRSGVLLYTIGIGNPNARFSSGGPAIAIGPFAMVVGGGDDERVDSQTLRQLSEESGGEHFLLNPADVVGSAAVLDTAVQTISRELRQQYTLGYASALPADQYRSIRVETPRDDVVVRTQKGYAAE